uniref:Gustatory receptor n=1 Tax=Tribolium castaneum TaxID=7070 RepID=C0Z3P9_TRICA|nr:olfactory receptor 2 [Tribolium castaneum]
MFKTVTREKVFQKFTSSIRMLLIQGQIFGLITFGCSNRCFFPSKIRICWNVLLNCVYLFLCGFCVYEFASDERIKLVIKAIIIMILSGCIIFTEGIWICSLIHRKKIVKFLDGIMAFDIQLKQVVNYKKKKFQRMVVARYVYYATIFTIITATSSFVTIHNVIGQFLGYFIGLITFVMSQHCVELVSMIKARFVVVNQQIGGIVTYFSTNLPKRETEVRKKSLDFGKLCSLHHHLSKLIKSFNEIYGVPLLLFFGLNFLIITQAMFLVVGQLQASQIHWQKIIIIVMSSVTYGIDTVAVCDACYSTIEEVISGI